MCGVSSKSGIGFFSFWIQTIPFYKGFYHPSLIQDIQGKPSNSWNLYEVSTFFWTELFFHLGVSKHRGIPQNGRVIMENPHFSMDDLGDTKFSIRNRSRLLDALGLGLADGISFGATVNACDRASQWEVAIELITEMQRRRMQQNLGACLKSVGKLWPNGH